MPGGNIQSKRNSKVQALRQKCAWYIKKIMKCQNGGNRMSKESGRRGGRHVGGGGQRQIIQSVTVTWFTLAFAQSEIELIGAF